ncbi:MAG: metallophosphoesterase [Geminicoccaceae bacterium]
MKASWLQVSDFHFRGGDPYERDVVLRALVRSVREFRERGRRPDLIFATGDVAHGGKRNEYEAATVFFDALLAAAGVERRQLHVIPGNHDIDRDLGVGLARTLGSGKEANTYFGPDVPKTHLLQKQREFLRWYDAYFAGIRTFPQTSTCGPVALAEVGSHRIGILPLNSALFCQDDHDHGRLWVGRRCLDASMEDLQGLKADLNIALVHHPLDWLHDVEGANIRAKLQSNVDLILRGHLHKTDVESVAGVHGEALHMAAGAAYQGSEWPNRALYVTWDDGRVDVFPIRYEDEPHEVWTVDPSVFPRSPQFTGSFPIPRLANENDIAAARPAAVPAPTRRSRSNIPSRRNLPFIGREDLLGRIAAAFDDKDREAVLVLHGQPGVGKSELAREFARRQGDAYPGGRFIVEAGRQVLAIDLARIGTTMLGLDFPGDMPLADQAQRTLAALGTAPALLIFDNVRAPDDVLPWLPPAGMPCHVLMTSTLDRWDAGWQELTVPPLSPTESVELVAGIADAQVAQRFGPELARLAEGLPVQIVPASATLAYEARRGRLDAASITLSQEARESFLGVYQQLDAPARLLLHAACRLDPQRIPRDELQHHLAEGAKWSGGEFQQHLDACLDLHLLQEGAELRMHQLFASFLRANPIAEGATEQLRAVVHAQAQSMIAVARELAANPNRATLAAGLLSYPVDIGRWDADMAGISFEGETLGRALYEIGQYEAARPWFERAVKEKEQGDVHGRVDHASLGISVHLVGYCLSQLGQYEAARPWFERALKETEQGDVHGRVDHECLGVSVHQVGYCLSQLGQYEAARPWFERAVTEAEQGDVHGRVDYASLGSSVHLVGWCLSQLGQYEAARPWFERAVKDKEHGDVHGRVDHESLSVSLHLVGDCLARTDRHEVACLWYM